MKACVIYDIASGQILHTHSVVVAPEVTFPTEEEIEQQALELFRRSEANRKRVVHTLHLKETDLRGLPFAVKVDLRARRLIIRDSARRTAD
jgi:hypothetical protein